MNEPVSDFPPADAGGSTGRECGMIDCPQARLFSVAAVALAVGFLLGLMCHRKEETLQEKYLEAPLNDLRKAIGSLSTIAAKKAAGGGEAAADMIDSLSDKIRTVVKSL